MGILIRHTARSIRDNLGQLIVILLTVTLVSAVFFVTLTIGGLFTNLQTSLKSRLGNGADLAITGTFSERKIKNYAENNADIEFFETYLQLGGLFRATERSESKVVLVEATDLKKYTDLHGKQLIVADSYEYSYGYPEVFVGESFAKENGIKAGDKVRLEIASYDLTLTLTVSYVFKNYGLFANNVVNNVVVDYDTIADFGIVSVANFKVAEGSVEKVRAELTELFPTETVSDSVNHAEVDRIVGNNQNLLNVALVFVTAMMIFILFSAYLVIAKKRAREFAVFRAVGASTGTIVWAMILEGLLYGLAGAVVGAMIGRIGMGVAVDRVIPNFPDAVSYEVKDYLLSVLFGGLVSAGSALVPIIRVVRRSVRGSTDEVRTSKLPVKRRLIFLAVAAVLTAVSVTLLVLLPDLSLLFTVLLVVSSAAFVYAGIPYVVRCVSKLLSYAKVSRPASMSVKRNPQGHLLSGLVGFIIVFTFLVVSIVNVIISAITPVNTRFSADFAVESVQGDLEKMRDEISSVYGVTEAENFFYDTVLDISDAQTGVSKGVDERGIAVYSADYGDAIHFLSRSVDTDVKTRFDTVLHPVIVSYDIVKRYGVSVGDRIVLRVGRGNLSDVFTVVGVDYTATSDDRFMIIRRESFAIDGNLYQPKNGVLFINTDKTVPNADLYRELRLSAERNSCYVLKFDDWAYATSVGITGVATLLRILQVVVSAVALIGVVNLTVVTLYERRRELNVFFAVGLGKSGYVRLALFESFVLSLSGAVVGVGLSLVVNLLLPVFSRLIDRYPDFAVFPWELAAVAAAAILAYALVYVLAAAARRRADTVERNLR